MKTKHGVFLIQCDDNPRGYVWEAWYFGKFLGSYDYNGDAHQAFNSEYER